MVFGPALEGAAPLDASNRRRRAEAIAVDANVVLLLDAQNPLAVEAKFTPDPDAHPLCWKWLLEKTGKTARSRSMLCKWSDGSTGCRGAGPAHQGVRRGEPHPGPFNIVLPTEMVPGETLAGPRRTPSAIA